MLAQQRDYDSIAQAADLDPYEWADYELSYVVAASAEENLPDDMRAVMERYLADLAALHSNSVPRYLAQCYFNLNDVDDGFAMLEQYVDYTPSDPATWENSFRVAMEYDDGSDAFRQGVAALAQRLSHWNDANLGTITLPDDVQAYLNKQWPPAADTGTCLPPFPCIANGKRLLLPKQIAIMNAKRTL